MPRIFATLTPSTATMDTGNVKTVLNHSVASGSSGFPAESANVMIEFTATLEGRSASAGNLAIVSQGVDYSIDNGISWLPALAPSGSGIPPFNTLTSGGGTTNISSTTVRFPLGTVADLSLVQLRAKTIITVEETTNNNRVNVTNWKLYKVVPGAIIGG